MKRKKLTLKTKKKMFKDTFDPTSSSKYALKKKQQKRGKRSPNSPIKIVEVEVNDKPYSPPLNLYDID